MKSAKQMCSTKNTTWEELNNLAKEAFTIEEDFDSGKVKKFNSARYNEIACDIQDWFNGSASDKDELYHLYSKHPGLYMVIFKKLAYGKPEDWDSHLYYITPNLKQLRDLEKKYSDLQDECIEKVNLISEQSQSIDALTMQISDLKKDLLNMTTKFNLASEALTKADADKVGFADMESSYRHEIIQLKSELYDLTKRMKEESSK